MMKTLFFLTIAAMIMLFLPQAGQCENEGAGKPPIIILKLDDLMRLPANDNWQRCLDFLAKNKIKCGVGIIGFSLEKDDPAYFRWIKEQNEKGMIEFWCHGYKNRTAKDKSGEFEGSYEEQKKIFEKCQALAKEKLGFPLKSFGPHWSGTNAGTVKAMSEIPEFTSWMYGDLRDAKACGKYIYPRFMALEYTTFVPNVEKFKEAFKKFSVNRDCLVLQGHPAAWVKDDRWQNFVAIIEFLKSRNCEFMTPSEYLEKVSKRN